MLQPAPRTTTRHAFLWYAGSTVVLLAALVAGMLVGPAGLSDWAII